MSTIMDLSVVYGIPEEQVAEIAYLNNVGPWEELDPEVEKELRRRLDEARRPPIPPPADPRS